VERVALGDPVVVENDLEDADGQPVGRRAGPAHPREDDGFSGRAEWARLSPEIRQWEDRFGLGGPKSLLALRWRLPGQPSPADVDREREIIAQARAAIADFDPSDRRSRLQIAGPEA
jgi:hypothetical protein